MSDWQEVTDLTEETDEKNRCERCGIVHGVEYVHHAGKIYRRELKDAHANDCVPLAAGADLGNDGIMRV